MEWKQYMKNIGLGREHQVNPCFVDGGRRVMTRDELIDELRRLPYDEVKIADFILAREKALLAEIEKPLKELSRQFEYFKAYQNENLVYGQTLESASENWSNMIDPSLDFGKIDEALAIIAKHGGQRDGD